MIRRNLLKSIWHINERTDHLAFAITLLYLASMLATPYYDLSHYIKKVLVGMHVLVGLILLTYLFFRVFLRNPNRRWLIVLTKEESRALGQWLKKGQDSASFNSGTCRFKFPTGADIELLAKLNFEAFRSSAYEASYEQFRERNAGFISRHKKCFMLMIDPIEGKDIIGYSCLLPLTKTGAQLYLDGGLSDATLPKSLVATSKEVPAAILMFAIHLKDEYSFTKSGASRKYSRYFWSCIRLHIELLYPRLYRQSKLPPLYAQAAESSLRRKLRRMGFINTKRKSRDGYHIWELKMVSSVT